MGTKKKKERASPEDRVRRLFRHFHPARVNDSGFQAWFRRELANRDVVVTAKTVSLWFKNGIPVDRIALIGEAITDLEAIMIDDLKMALSEVSGR